VAVSELSESSVPVLHLLLVGDESFRVETISPKGGIAVAVMRPIMASR
jgi:hypothetical protein